VTVARGLLALTMLIAVGVAIVALRQESAKVANRTQSLYREQAAFEQRLWKAEMDLARLRGPDEIRRRARSLGLRVVPPAATVETSGGESWRD